MLRVEVPRVLGALEGEREPLLDASHPARCARSVNRMRSSTMGAARMESEQRKSIFICMGCRSHPNRSTLSQPSLASREAGSS